MNNQYNISLITEQGLLSEIYKEEIYQLKEKFFANPNFSSVKEYTFKEEDSKIVIDNFNKPENHLVFVLSGAVSSLWQNNEAFNFFKDLEKEAIVCMVNILPNRMWRGIPLDTYGTVETVVPTNIKNNAQLENTSDFDRDWHNAVVLPITTLKKTEELISTIINGGKVSNAVLYKNNRSPELNSSTKKEVTPAMMVGMYRQLSLQDDYSLAVYFSTVKSFTVSDIEFVRQHMLPTSDKSSLAGFIFGGLVEKAPVISNDKIEFEHTTIINKNTPEAYSLTMNYSSPQTMPFEQRYQLKPGVAEELIKSLCHSEEHAINLLLNEKKNQDAMNEMKIKLKI